MNSVTTAKAISREHLLTEGKPLNEAAFDSTRVDQVIGDLHTLDKRISEQEDQHSPVQALQTNDLAGTKATGAARELRDLQARKRLLVGNLARAGFPTSRWIGHGDDYYHLRPSKVSKQARGPYQLYRIPKASREQILAGEDPEITTRRIAYTHLHNRSMLRGHAIVAAPLGSYSLLTHVCPTAWSASVSLALLLIVMAIFRDGTRYLFTRFSSSDGLLPPMLEIMPYTGESWQRSSDGEGHAPSQNELLRAIYDQPTGSSYLQDSGGHRTRKATDR